MVGGLCDYCVSPSPKNWVLWFFRLGQDLGPVGMEDWDLNSAMTTCIEFQSNKHFSGLFFNVPCNCNDQHYVKRGSIQEQAV